MDIKRVIKEKGLTLEQTATKMGISRITLMQSLGGNPTVNTLQRVADAIGCRVVDFFADEIEESTPQTPTFICPHCGKPLDVVVQKKEKDLD